MNSEIFRILEIMGTVAFSISEVFAAMQQRLDILGIFIIAFITAIGGGTIRDVIIGDYPVNWMRTNLYSISIFASAGIAIMFYKKIKNYDWILQLFDSIGLGFFTLLGIHKGLEFNFPVGLCIAFGTMTACFGGMARDICLNQIPHIFHKEIYATACILGGLLYFLLRELNLPTAVVDSTCIISIVVIRLMALKFNWSLPDLYRYDKKE